MSYRDDLAAAQARAEAAERRAAALQKRIDELEEAQGARRSEAERAAADKVRQVPIPERFEVLLEPGTLRVRWRWFRPVEHMFLFFFCLLWDVMLGIFVVAWFREQPSWTILLASGHIAAGIGMTYSLIAGLFNRTTVSASAGRLRIAHGPIRWRGNRVLSRAQIRQLYVASKNKKYDLCAVLDDDRQIKLVKGLHELAQARYLEHAFELHLGIEDHPVADEAPKQ